MFQHPLPQPAPAAHRRTAFAPAPAHTARARPGRRRRRTGWRASCGSLGSRRCDVGPHPTAGVPGVQCGSRGCAASHSRARRWASAICFMASSDLVRRGGRIKEGRAMRVCVKLDPLTDPLTAGRGRNRETRTDRRRPVSFPYRPSASTGYTLPTVRNQQASGSSPLAGSIFFNQLQTYKPKPFEV